ncbi:MAG TPA: preprotein translocase subunit YajC [Burkholderiales bacterium]
MLISSAFAQAPAAGGAPDLGLFSNPLIFIIIMFAVMYFAMIRPQMKRAKETKAMNEALQKGDEVLTAGGVVGRITKIGEQYVTLEIAPGTEIVVQRSAVQAPLPKGTIKSVQ